ncbi:U3 small nucleolar RNA-interacting protein 2, putative [Plasmodium vinckei lentum]|uniref:U3 small nucleolar RNA-interacting protein 2, putative n=1 Tax=Plasmodium vinckei lentum TaxID=138297 RepID=A0A6V7T125_PLAVN|nr:U3 small nucleolar RNA-interacting protein 2, putative [Plasmodium vinckei lentum]
MKKFNKRKNNIGKKGNYNNRNKNKKVEDSEIESDDILSSNLSEEDNIIVNKKTKFNDEIIESDEDGDYGNKNNSDEDDEYDGFNNPEERKMYLAKKYLKDMGIESSEEEDSSGESENSDNEQNKKKKLSSDYSSDDSDIDKKEKIKKMLMEKESSKYRKTLLNLRDKIRIFYDEELSNNLLTNNDKKDKQNMNNLSKKVKNDDNVLFFNGHKKSVTTVACPDYNLSFFDHYDYKITNNNYDKYNNEKLNSYNDHTDSDDESLKNISDKIMHPKSFENTSINTIYTGGKDACIIEWDLYRQEKVHIYKGNPDSFKDFGNQSGICHFKSVMDIYCNKYNSFFMSVGCDNLINVWDNRTKKTCMNSVIGHKNIITSIVGCNDDTEELNMEHNFFTSSYDKTIKLWDLRFFNKCINTYLGHTNNILTMNSLSQNKLLTSSSDYTIRFWNTKNDNHILFNINYEIIESCCTLNNKIFVAGTFSGALYIFTSSYKKPICIHKNAHSSYPITALISIPYTNIFISGSYDGYVHFWEYKSISKISANIHKIMTIQLNGTVNKFSFAHNYKYLFAAIGNEMKHGRWDRTKNKNGLAVIPIQFLS